MKTLFLMLVASLALATTSAAREEISPQAWLETYYIHQSPAQLTRAVKGLSRSGYFEKPGHTAVAIGFLSTVFAKYPEKVDGWLLELNDLPQSHHRLIAAALWQAGNPLGNELLEKLGAFSEVRQDVLRLANAKSTPVSDTPVLSPSSMNLQWGAFLATGSDRYVINILDAMGNERPALDAAARVALAQNAATHPRVAEICRAQLDRQPENVRAEVRAALQQAAVTTKPGV